MTDEDKNNPEPTKDSGSEATKPKSAKRKAAKSAAEPDKKTAKTAGTDRPEAEPAAEQATKEKDMADTPQEDTESRLVIDKSVWLRGLWMLVLAVLFGIAETVLLAAAVIQFLWMVFAKEKNRFIADFGKDLSAWLSKTARFQTGASDEKPFPWSSWKA